VADTLDLATRFVAHPICWAILLNGLDDLFIDVTYYARGLFREEKRRISLDDLNSVEQKRIALMIPAWQEEAVIKEMLEHNLEHLDYRLDRFDIFVGTYRNDTATQERVEQVERKHKNVHKVVTPHDGPTNKADNLNWIYQGIQVVEERRGQRFDILLMHDSEDLIHPFALKLYNFLIPRYEFVQTPVFPLERPLRKLLGATYMDEFTEHHLKDMLVREHIGGLVPSAGVGSAFSRDCFEEIAFAHSQKAFNTDSLTEDYEIGTKFRLAEKRVFFASQAIATVKEVERGWFTKRRVRIVDDEYIATREYFPDTFTGAVRQRSRWVLGIALQGWEQIGWKGSLPVLYCLWRDRKALITNYLTIAAYALALYAVVRLVVGMVTHQSWTFDNIFPPGSMLWWLVMLNTVVLGWRVFMKFATVDRIYGTLHGLFSVPRFFVANLINFAATSRALYQYVESRITGVPVRWDKTEHSFPSAAALRAYQRRLGELLLDRRGITEDQLIEALDLQQDTGMRLGDVLTMTGMSTVEQVTDALGDQLEMPVADLDPYAVPLRLLRNLPESEALELGVMPLALEADGSVRIASSTPVDSEVRERLAQSFQARVVFDFAPEDALVAARQRAYRRLLSTADDGAVPRRLGEALVARGVLLEDDLQRALREQRSTGEPLGELLVRRGLVPAEEVSQFLAARVHETFRTVSPRDLSPKALEMVGYGACALYGMAPLRPDTRGAALPIASCSPIHADVRDQVVERLGGVEVSPVLAPAVDVRLALAVAAPHVWPEGLCAGIGGLDGAELAAIDDYPGWQGDPADLLAAARAAGCSPVDFLVTTQSVSRGTGARLRARALGVDLAGPARRDEQEARGWLPPGLALREDIQLLDNKPGRLVVAAPAPRAHLTRRLSAMFPDTAICWRVAPYSKLPQTHTQTDRSEA